MFNVNVNINILEIVLFGNICSNSLMADVVLFYFWRFSAFQMVRWGHSLFCHFRWHLNSILSRGSTNENPPYDHCLPKTQSSTEPSSGLGRGHVQPPLCSSALEREIFLGEGGCDKKKLGRKLTLNLNFIGPKSIFLEKSWKNIVGQGVNVEPLSVSLVSVSDGNSGITASLPKTVTILISFLVPFSLGI